MYDASGKLKRCRARLCTKGFTQIPGVHCDKILAPDAWYTALRFVMAIKASRNYDVEQIDVKNAFLNGSLEEEIYFEIPNSVSID